jgi:hypothetical protein
MIVCWTLQKSVTNLSLCGWQTKKISCNHTEKDMFLDFPGGGGGGGGGRMIKKKKKKKKKFIKM